MKEEIAEELRLQGNVSSQCIQRIESVTRKELVVKLSCAFRASMIDRSIPCRKSKQCLPQQSVGYEDLSKEFPHSRGLPVRSFSNAVPTILIGLNHAALYLTLDKRERRSRHSKPTMVDDFRKTRLHSFCNLYFAVKTIGVNPM